MRVVLDTNVLVAALLTQGAAAQVVDLWLAGRYTLLTAEVQLRELRRVLRDKFPELPAPRWVGSSTCCAARRRWWPAPVLPVFPRTLTTTSSWASPWWGGRTTW